MSEKDEAYWRAMRDSFSNLSAEETVPINDTDTRPILLGYQTFGIVSKPFEGGDFIGGTDYDLPGAFEGFAKISEGGTELSIKGRWMHGAKHGVEQRRAGFPDVPAAGQANRIYSVNFGTDGLWVNRGDPDFFVVRPPTPEENAWRTIRKVSLPKVSGEYRFVPSAWLRETELITVETDATSNFFLVRYDRESGDVFKERSVTPIPQWRYGIALAEKNGKVGVITVTAYQTAEPPGIYFDDELIVPRMYGSGFAWLQNGAALVSSYGREEKTSAFRKGTPGRITYVPRGMFPKDITGIR